MNRLKTAIETLDPAYFSLVMATGIVSLAALALGLPLIAHTLLWLNVPFYILLILFTMWRIVFYREQILLDLKDHQRGVGFFTAVAASGVLANQFVFVKDFPAVATILGVIAVFLWLLLTYTILGLFTIKQEKPPLAVGINGGWLVSIVATQSVSLIAGILASHYPAEKEAILFFALVLWLAGGMLYLWITVLIFYRYTFLPMSANDMSPPYWINMGAMAISTLAGTSLIEHAHQFALLSDLLPFLKGVTILFWATASWWIPLLLILGMWRHGIRRVKLTYDPAYWSIVFPLGMYSVSTQRLTQTLPFPPLLALSKIAGYISIAVWMITLAGLGKRILFKGTGAGMRQTPAVP